MFEGEGARGVMFEGMVARCGEREDSSCCWRRVRGELEMRWRCSFSIPP